MSFKAAILILFLFSPLLLAADRYYCPMHCEGSKTYEHPGQCPVCHMQLEKEASPTDDPRNQAVTAVKYSVSGPTGILAAGSEIEIPVTPRLTSNGTALVDFDGEPLKVDLTSQDLGIFERKIVKKGPNGTFSIKHAFAKGGNYILYVRFTPKAEHEQVFPVAIQVDPPLKSNFDLRQDRNLEKKSNDFSARLSFSNPPVAMKSVQLEYRIHGLKKTKARVILVSEDTTWYLDSVEPMQTVKGVSRVFRTVRFPQAGFYRAWIENEYGDFSAGVYYRR